MYSFALGQTLEEIHDSGLQRIFGTNHEEASLLDSRLEDFRSVPQMGCGDADVAADGVPHERFRVVPKVCRQQSFDRWPDTVDHRREISRLLLPRPHELFECGQNGPTPGVAQNNDERSAEPLRGEL